MTQVIIRRVHSMLKGGYPPKKLAQEFVRINQETWPPPIPDRYLWTEEKVLQHFATCPHMLFCAYLDGQMVGTLSAICITEKTAFQRTSWETTSGDGTFATHQPDGDCAFGLDLSVPPGGVVAGNILVESGIFSAVVLGNKKGVFLGSRVPRYRRYRQRSPDATIEEYIGLNGGKNHDPEIRKYQAGGFRIVKVLPGYMEDPESLNYGVLMFWENPFYRFTRHLGPALKVLSTMYHWLFLT